MSVRVRYAKPDGTMLEGMTDTVGGGGLYIESLTPLPEGTPLVMEFTMPGSAQPIRIEGEVVWTREKFERRLYYPGMGIRFTKIGESEESILLSLVDALLKKREEREKG